MQPSGLQQEEISFTSPPSRHPEGGFSLVNCNHSPMLDSQTSCGLCFFQRSFVWELPTRLHAYMVLAENGNPETSPKFLAHLQVNFGLYPPRRDQSLHEYREERRKFSAPAPGLFPVASIIWEMMGNQPPLAYPFYLAVIGLPEDQIAAKLNVSRYNLAIRLIKATRYAMRLYNGRYSTPQEPAAEAGLPGSTAEQRGPEQDPDGAAGAAGHRSSQYN